MTDQESVERKPETPKRVNIKSMLIPVAGIIVGAIGGYIYYIQVGCKSGTCAITSNPALTMLWGAILGFLIFDMFRKKPSKAKKDKTEHQS